MPEYKRIPYKLLPGGVSLRYPVDLLPDGKYPIMKNMVVGALGTMQPRVGSQPINDVVYPDPIHSIRRLNALSADCPDSVGGPMVDGIFAGMDMCQTVTPITAVCPLADLVVGLAYDETITPSGGTAPYTFALIAGALPDGLTLNPSTGEISGTPTVAGTFDWTIRITDANGSTFDLGCSSNVQSEGSVVLGGWVESQDSSYVYTGCAAVSFGSDGLRVYRVHKSDLTFDIFHFALSDVPNGSSIVAITNDSNYVYVSIQWATTKAAVVARILKSDFATYDLLTASMGFLPSQNALVVDSGVIYLLTDVHVHDSSSQEEPQIVRIDTASFTLLDIFDFSGSYLYEAVSFSITGLTFDNTYLYLPWRDGGFSIPTRTGIFRISRAGFPTPTLELFEFPQPDYYNVAYYVLGGNDGFFYVVCRRNSDTHFVLIKYDIGAGTISELDLGSYLGSSTRGSPIAPALDGNLIYLLLGDSGFDTTIITVVDKDTFSVLGTATISHLSSVIIFDSSFWYLLNNVSFPSSIPATVVKQFKLWA